MLKHAFEIELTMVNVRHDRDLNQTITIITFIINTIDYVYKTTPVCLTTICPCSVLQQFHN